MKNRNILILFVCSLFFFGLFTLVFANYNGLQLVSNDNGKMEACIDTNPAINQPADIITTTAGTETIDWILSRPGPCSAITHYWVTKDGASYITPQSWSVDELHIAIDRSVIGVFEYNITCNNTNDLKASDIVIVTVVAAPLSSLEIALIASVSIGAIGLIGALAFIGRRK